MYYIIKNLQKLRDKIRKNVAKFLFDYINKSGLQTPVRHILIIRWDAKFGDSFVSSFFFREIKKRPEIKVSVITSPSLVELHKDFFGADDVIDIKKRPSYKDICDVAKRISDVDTVIHLTEDMKMRDLYLLHKLQPKNVFSLDDRIGMVNIKLGETTKKLSFQEKYCYILRQLGINDINQQYIIPKKQNSVSRHYDVVINPFGSTDRKSMSVKRAVIVTNEISRILPHLKIGVLSSPATVSDAGKIVSLANKHNISLINGINSIYDVIDTIDKSNLIISVDTAITHIAVGLNKKIISIYYKNGTSFNPWLLSESDNVVILFSHGKEINLNGFDNNELISATKKLLN